MTGPGETEITFDFRRASRFLAGRLFSSLGAKKCPRRKQSLRRQQEPEGVPPCSTRSPSILLPSSDSLRKCLETALEGFGVAFFGLFFFWDAARGLKSWDLSLRVRDKPESVPPCSKRRSPTSVRPSHSLKALPVIVFEGGRAVFCGWIYFCGVSRG